MGAMKKTWTVRSLGECVEILDSRRIPVNSEERAKRPGNIPYYGATGQVGWIDDYLFDEEIVLLGEDGAPFFDKQKNVAFLVSGKSWVNNHAHVLKAGPVTTNQYLTYFLNHFDYRGYVNGTTRLKLTQANLRKISVPLPPLTEQKLIVNKLDRLFIHLNHIRERLDKIPALLKQFRQAVLTQAVTGKLTEEWRLQNSAKDWEKKSLEELTIKIGDGLHGTPKYDDNGDYYFINGNNLDDGRIIIKGSTRRINETEYARICNDLGSATILLSINGTLGKVALYNHEKVALGKSIAYFNLNAEEYKHYIRRYFESPHFQRTLVEIATGSTIKNVPLKGLRRHVIRIPPIQEQREIVRRVELLLEIVERIEMHYNALNVKIGQLPQAILSKAFTGELVKAVIKEYEMQLKEIEAIVAKESTPGNES